MSKIKIEIDHPLPYAKAVFVFLKQERETDDICLIYPTDIENQFTKNKTTLGMTNETKRDLIAMRETLKTVFEVNGLDFEKSQLFEYPKFQGERYYEPRKV